MRGVKNYSTQGRRHHSLLSIQRRRAQSAHFAVHEEGVDIDADFEGRGNVRSWAQALLDNLTPFDERSSGFSALSRSARSTGVAAQDVVRPDT